MFYKTDEYDLLHTFPEPFQNKISHASIEVTPPVSRCFCDQKISNVWD